MGGRVLLWDSTLRDTREAMGEPRSDRRNLELIGQLARAGVAETVVVAPDDVAEDIRFSRRVKAEGFDITLSGQVHANSPKV